MKTIDRKKRVISLVLAFLFIFSSVQIGLVFAVELSDEDQAKIDSYKAQEAELNKKIEESKQKINEMKDDIAQQKAYVEELTEQINNYQDKINVLNNNIAELERQKNEIQKVVDGLNAQIKEIEAKINHNELEQISLQQQTEDIVEDLKECLCNVYMKGTSSELELLLTSTDFSSFLIMMELTSNMAKQDDELIGRLKISIARIDELNAEQQKLIDEIEVKKAECDEQIKVLDEKQDAIEVSRDELQSAQDEVNSLYDEAMSYLNILDKQSDAYAALVTKYEAEIKAFENKIDNIIKEASRGSGQVGPGGMIWPLQYSDVYISSGFGYRSDPATGATKFHGGVDSCCWSGTSGKAISAAAAGTVIISTWHSSYGYYVGIDHGNGVVTIYAHNSQLLVSVGQHVNQGQTIAYAGSTGYSTGAHCHFEVRVNGEKVSPLGYASP